MSGPYISNGDRGPRCPDCKRIAIKLIPLNDNQSGIKLCTDCKRKRRRESDEQLAALFAEEDEGQKQMDAADIKAEPTNHVIRDV